jgi:hypothetical protein
MECWSDGVREGPIATVDISLSVKYPNTPTLHYSITPLPPFPFAVQSRFPWLARFVSLRAWRLIHSELS